MAKAITVRLDEAGRAALGEQAERLRVRPSTLARTRVRTELSGTLLPGKGRPLTPRSTGWYGGRTSRRTR